MKACLCKDVNVMGDFVSFFGNEEQMQTRYPKTYEAYTRTCKALACSKGKVFDPLEVYGNDIPEEFDIEVVHVSYTDSTKEYVQVDIRAIAMDSKGYCILNAFIPRLKEVEEELMGMDEISLGDVSCNFTGDQEEVSLQFPAKYFHAATDKEGSDAALEVVARLYTVDSQVAAYESSEIISLYGLDYTCTFNIDHPKRTHTNKENKNINISYRYKGGQFDESLRDYFYSSDKLRNGNLRIPSKGEIKVSGINITSLSEVMLVASNAAGKAFCHNEATAILEDRNTITWNMPADWGNSYEEILDTLYCYITYQLEIKVISQGKRYTFVVTNKENAKEANNKKIIDKICIYKDCFEGGTMIKMQSGTEKRIEDIHTGDMIAAPEGAVRVEEAQSMDMNVAMVHIKGENGKEISVSVNHPFVTDRGFVCAAFLQEGMEIHTEEGKTKITELCVTPGVKITLYQITLEDSNQLYANGFLVGDSAAELTAAERANNLRYQVCEGWEADYDSWAARNKIMTQHL